MEPWSNQDCSINNSAFVHQWSLAKITLYGSRVIFLLASLEFMAIGCCIQLKLLVCISATIIHSLSVKILSKFLFAQEKSIMVIQ